MAVPGFLRNVVLERVEGERPSAIRALTAAGVAGAATAFLTYKALRA
jgi:hypothetical protein